MQTNPILEVKNLHTAFFTESGRVQAVNGVSFSVEAGKTLGVVGESGSGKSVTAYSIMGILADTGRITDGEILYKGEDITKWSEKQMQRFRGEKCSIIFQDPMTSLNPVYTIGNQLEEAILLHTDRTRQEAKARAVEMLTLVGINDPERRLKMYPHELSGGLRQRVMIGMAMVCNPQLMIADEPTTALDVTIEAQILYLMNQLQKEQGTAIVMITHNLGVVAESCDYVYVMYAGKIMEEAPVRELFKNPMHPYTYGLMNSIPKMTESKEHLYTIRGLVPNLLHLPQGCRFCPRCDKAMKICTMYQPDMYETGDGHKVRCFLYNKEVMNSGK